jgi:hypothetical protein
MAAAWRRRNIRPDTYGNMSVSLVKKNGRPISLTLQRIVAQVFLGECPSGYMIQFRNGDKTDCRLENLQFVSAPPKKGPPDRVKRVSRDKITQETARQIKERLRNKVKTKEIMAEFNVSLYLVQDIRAGRVFFDV